MAELGWIKLYRQIMSSWLWNSNEPFDHRSAWIDMLLCANHEDKKACIDGKLIDVERGSFITSQLKLAKRWKWDRKKVKRFLDLLEQDGMVSVNSTTRRTTVTIENYDKYQDCGTSPATGITPSPTPSSGQVLPQVLPTNKNDKNVKNDKKYKEDKEESSDAERPAPRPNVPYAEIQAAYNELCPSLARCKTLSEARKKAIRARMTAGYTLEDFKTVFAMAESSTFLKGANNRDWRADFEWLIKDANMAKVLDGKYEDRKPPHGSEKSSNPFLDMLKSEGGNV